MEVSTFTYNNKFWRLSATKRDNDSFFHAAFGARGEDNVYYDPQAQYRRRRYINFLTHYQTEVMPPCVEIILRRCFNYQSKHASFRDNLARYISELTRKPITIEELPFLGTLENIKIVVLPTDRPKTAILMTPSSEILGTYTNPVGIPKDEVVLCLEGDVFSRLKRVEAREMPGKSVVPSTYSLGKYKKVGSIRDRAVHYQVDLLLVFLLNAVQTLDKWRISTMNKEAGRFDAIVLESSRGAILLQAKFKENSTKRITLEKLISTEPRNDFNLVKYFLSYQKIKKKFEIKNVVICTNLTFSKEVYRYLNFKTVTSDDLLHFEYGCGSCYTVSDRILPDLKAALTRSGNNDTEISAISNESIEDFLSHLQFYCNFSRNTLQDVIEKLWSVRKLQSKASLWEIYFKVMDWYLQDKGKYLSDVHVNAMLSEIWRDKYYHTLDQYNVHFQNIVPLHQNSKQILHIVIEDIYFLHVIKLYQVLWNHKSKVLWTNPEDDIYTQKLVLEAFRKLHYLFLIIIWPKDTEQWVVTEICRQLKDILNQGKKYKKVILVAEEILISGQSELKIDERDTVRDFVSFRKLTDDTRSRLLLQENIVFQGARISLSNLFAPQKVEEYKEILNLATLNKLVEGEDIKIGSPVLGLDENIAQYYLPRKFKRKIHNNDDDDDSEENYSEGTIYDLKEKTIVISDSAGSGKSTVLSKVAMTLKQKYPSLWIININLINCTEILRTFMLQGRETIDVTELLNSREATKLRNGLEGLLFSMEEKVILILDGVDEVVPDYKNLVISLLDQCREAPNLAKIFVATRPNLTRELEEVFKVTAFALQPLSEQEQVDLLTAYWTHTLNTDENDKGKCNRYAKALVEKISLWIHGNSNKNFTDTPLQIKMLADVFCEAGNNWDGCKGYLNGDTDVPILPEKIDIVGLYDTFIKRKRDFFLEKTNPNGNPMASLALASQFDECLAYHRSLALEAVMKEADHYTLTYCRKGRKDTENCILKMGIVQKSGDEFKFIHQTFAEYFLAGGILKQLQLFNEDMNFQKLLVDEILSKESFIATRAFLDGFLQNNALSLPSDVIESFANLLTPEREYALQSVLEEEDFPAVRQLISKFLNARSRRDTNTNVKSNFDKFYDLYYQKRFVEVKRPIFRSSVRSIKKFNIQQDSSEGNLRKYHTGPLHSAAEDGELTYIKHLIEIGVDINIIDFQGRTPLHLAAKNGHIDTVEWLMENGADRNITDNRGDTALYLAAIEGHPDIVKYLAKQDIELTDRNLLYDIRKTLEEVDRDFETGEYSSSLNSEDDADQWNTFEFPTKRTIPIALTSSAMALHLAVTGGNLETVKNVLKTGVDVNVSGRNGQTALHAAVRHNELAMVKFLLERGADSNIKDDDDCTALHLAAEDGNLEIVKFLVEHGVDVNATDDEGCTALHLAAWDKALDTVKFLLEHGIDFNIRDNNGRKALHLAAENGELEIVKFLLKHEVDNIEDSKGCTPLHLAAKSNALDTLQDLVNYGIDMNVTESKGRTPLHFAAEYGDWDTVMFLAESGAALNVTESDGRTALHLAANYGETHTLKYLLEFGVDFNVKDADGRTALHLAAKNGALESVKLLVEYVDHNVKDNTDCTPLELAKENNHVDTVKFLTELGVTPSVDEDQVTSKDQLETTRHLGQIPDVVAQIQDDICDADIDIVDSESRTALGLTDENDALDTAKFLSDIDVDTTTENVCNPITTTLFRDVPFIEPRDTDDITTFYTENTTDVEIDLTADANNEENELLHKAALEGKLDTLRSLLDRGIDNNIKDDEGRTPLHLAASQGHSDIVEFLLDHDADVNLRDNDGNTALHVADEGEHLDIVKLLISRGADVGTADGNGNTALHCAAECDRLNTVEYLVREANADVSVKGNGGRTPLHSAVKWGNLDVAKFLLERGETNVNSTDAVGRTPLHYAAEWHDSDIVELLVENEAHVDVGDCDGYTALHLAVKWGNLDAVEYLVGVGADVNAINGKVDTLKYLLENGADRSIRDKNDCTALNLAQSEGHMDIVQYTTKDMECIEEENKF